jgi:hypothetical protein
MRWEVESAHIFHRLNFIHQIKISNLGEFMDQQRKGKHSVGALRNTQKKPSHDRQT